MNTTPIINSVRRGLLAFALAVPVWAGAVTLADQPLFSTVSVPGNLALALSVEFPTALSPAYPNTTTYSANSTYIGYFDPEKCYVYQYILIAPANSYFAPFGSASSHACTTTTTRSLWSGNYLNWASMGALDTFRSVLTGGYRVTDGTTDTVLEKAYNFNSGVPQTSNTPDKTITASTTIRGATPFTWSSATTKVWHQGAAMLITGTSTVSGGASGTSTCYQGTTCVNIGSPAAPYIPQTPANNGSISYYSGQSSSAGTANAANVYLVYIRVKVCDTGVGVESNCVRYGSNYKPEGLLQKYSSKLRYSAFGYLNIPSADDANVQTDGGVMRARMKHVGPTKPVPGSSDITNPDKEWNSSTGVFVTNPDVTDAAATVTTFGLSNSDIPNSGVLNYLNKFGSIAKDYKTFDPVSELYNAVLRYFKHVGNPSTYTSGMTSAARADGFPVIKSWDDPILYSCQKNFILGIGDVNAMADANLEDSIIKTGHEVSATPSTITSVGVNKATKMVGTLEGISGLNTAHPSNPINTYLIAGLAYDAHTVDMRSDLNGDQLVNTYWLDVWEYQTYKSKNQYWLAAKYGGFDAPAGFSPYSSSNGVGTIPDSAWYTSTDTVGSDKRPDNYFAANQADKMKSGLTSALAKIVSEASATATTAYSPVTRKTSSTGEANYTSSYDPKFWTGELTASTLATNADGSTTTSSVWEAQTLLDSIGAGNRKIVTCCTSSGAGLAFTYAALNGSSLNSRTYFTSFSNVPGASSQSASNFVAYLRGDTSKEVAKGGAYRNRAHLLGDIVDSKVEAVGAPAFPYYDAYNAGYSSFKSAHNSRNRIIYVGANDGMMHAFDGSLTSTNKGKERFAYIPSFTYGDSSNSSDRYFATYGLASLGNPSYAHHYFVNATPRHFDVDLAKAGGVKSGGTDWRTLLIGGLGKGGKGYYAIDVTDPSSWTSESVLAGKVMWEFTDSRMGYTFGDAHVVKTVKYGWVVIVASGLNNSDGKGYIFIVNPKDGSLLEAVGTTSGATDAPINLSYIRAFINDYGDYSADSVYGADLQGNLWRFDLSGTGSYPAPTKIATLTNAAGNALPATTPPLIGVDPTTKKRYVMVGTGQQLSDNDINSTTRQAFYAIVDGTGDAGGFYSNATLPSGYSFPIRRSDLTAVTTFSTALTSSASPMGWYYDFTADSTTSVAERMNVEGDVALGMVAFSVNQPNGSACSPGGSSRTFAVRFATGKSALLNASGELVQYVSNTDTTLDLLFTKSSDGTTSLTRGGSSSTTQTTVDAGLSGFKHLSWREASTVD